MRPSLASIARMSLAGGIRAPKREKIWKDEHQKACDHSKKRWVEGDTYLCMVCDTKFEWRYAWQPPNRPSPPPRLVHIKTPTREKGNLKNEDYRFWVGHENVASVVSYCRACRAMAYSVRTMLDHMEEYKCTIWLVEAYSYLLRFKKCVVCEAACNGTTWGVPLCSPACIEKWKFGTHPHAELQVALALTDEKTVKTREQSKKAFRERHNETDQSTIL